MMKAVVYENYGSPNELKLVEVPKPKPRPNEVLVKVKAASINSWDWDLLIGTGISRLLFFSFSKPRMKILGCDIAGIVEEKGNGVSDINVGDEIFGDISGANWGGFAEYVCAPAKLLAKKPKEITFEEAASAPQGAVLALQGFMKKGIIQSYKKVLLIGAGGAVGTFALQIAKHYESEVTCVDRGNKLDFLKSLGADQVLDYQKSEINNLKDKYDLIIDPVMKRPISIYNKLLSENGKFSMVGGENSKIFQTLFLGTAISIFTKKQLGILAHVPNRKDLEIIGEMMASRKISPVIDKVFPLERTPEAFKYYSEGNFIGKIVITI